MEKTARDGLNSCCIRTAESLGRYDVMTEGICLTVIHRDGPGLGELQLIHATPHVWP
jgi:hypothetical protein